jgi:predicted metal-dependent phosphoesterase TrpH
MRVNSYLEALLEEQSEVACLTNHGDLRDFDYLKQIAPEGMLLIPGVEISSEAGDFVLFSTDYHFLDSLLVMQELPSRSKRPAETAVVWAHPFAGMGANVFGDDYIAEIADQVDGIEVYNGNWLDLRGVELARKTAVQYSLAELGCSDAHRRENLFRCWTEVDGISSASAFIAAIRERKTRAVSRVNDG